MPGAVTVGELVVNMSANVGELRTDMTEAAGAVQNSAKSMINSMLGVSDSSDRMTDAGARMIKSLQDEIATFGMTSQELLLHKANLNGVGVEAQNLIARLDAMKSAQVSLTAAVDESATSSKVQADSLIRLAQSEAETTSRIRDMVAASIAQAAATETSIGTTELASAAQVQLGASYDRTGTASRLWQQNMAGVSAAIKSTADQSLVLSANTQRILDKYDPLGTKLRSLQSDMATLRKEMGDSVSPAAMKAFQGLEDEIEKTGKLMETAGVEGFEKSGEAATKSGLATAGATRELIVLAHEAMTGNFSKMPGSFMVLAERMDATALLLNPLTLGFAALGAAVVGVATLAQAGHDEFVGLNNALLVTSNYSGQTRESVQALEMQLTRTGEVTIGTSKDIVTSLVASGQIGGQALGVIARLTSDYAKSTNQDIGSVAPKLAQLFADPLRGAQELNQSMNFLTQTDIDHIATLVRLGEKQQAQYELAQKLSDFLPKQAANVTWLGAAFNGLSGSLSGAGAALKSFFGTGVPVDGFAQKVRDAQSYLDSMINANQFGQYTAQIEVARTALAKMIADHNVAAAAATTASQVQSAADDKQAAAQVEVNKGQLTHIQQLKDELTLVASAPDSNAKAQRQIELQKEIAAAYRTMGADARAASQEQINNQQALNDISDKGAADQLGASLQLGTITKQQFDAQTTQNKLNSLDVKALNELKLANLSGLTSNERQAHLDRMGQLRAEYDLTKQQGDTEQALDQAASYQDVYKSVIALGTAENQQLDDAIKKQQEHNAEIGKTKAQIDQLKQASEQLDTVQMQSDADFIRNAIQQGGMDDQALAAYQLRLNYLDSEIAKRTALAGLIGAASTLEADTAAAKKAQEAWTSSEKSIENGLYNAITGGGDSAAKKLIKDLEYAFARLELSPIITPISGALASIANPTVSAASLGSAGGAINAASAAGATYSAITGGVAASVGGGISSIGGALGSSAIAEFGSGVSGSAGAAAAALGGELTGAASAGAAFSAALSAALPWVAGAAVGFKVISSLFDSGPESDTRLTFASNNAPGNISINERGNQGQSDSYIGSTGTSSFGTFGVSSSFWTDASSAAVQALIKNIATTDDALATYLTNDEKTAVTTALTNHTDSIHTGAEGSDQNATGQLDSVFTDRITTILNAVQPGLADLEKGFSGTSEQLATEAAALLSFRSSLQSSGQAIFGAQVTLEQIAALKQPTEATSAALTRVAGEFTATNAVADSLGKDATTAFGAVGLASESTRASLIQLAGGVSNLTSQASDFASNYLTDAEKIAPVAKAVQTALDQLGLSSVSTREQFKAVVDGLDLTTAAGQQEYVSLMALEGAFAQVHAATDDATASVRSATDIANERSGLQDQLDNLTMTSTQLLAKQRAALDASNDGLFDQVQAAQAAADAQAKAASDAGAILDQQAQLYTATGNAAGAAAVLEKQHQAALSGLSPALAAATQATWDAQAAASAQSKALAESNSLLDVEAQLYAVTGDAAGAAAVLEKQHAAALALLSPELQVATQALWDAQAAASQATSEAAAVAAQQTAASDALASFAASIKQTVDNATAATKAFQDFSASLYVGSQSSLSAAAQYGIAKQAFESASPDDLQAASTAFLTAAKANDSSAQYALDFGSVQAALARAVGGEQATIRQANGSVSSVPDILKSLGIGAHANGGIASGLSLVGEDGPEIANFSQPAQISTADQTKQILSGGSSAATEALLGKIVTAVAGLQTSVAKISASSSKVADIVDRITQNQTFIRVKEVS